MSSANFWNPILIKCWTLRETVQIINVILQIVRKAHTTAINLTIKTSYFFRQTRIDVENSIKLYERDNSPILI